MLVYVYVCVQMLGMYVLVCVHKYVHMYACMYMYVRVCVIGMKPKNVYILKCLLWNLKNCNYIG